MAAAGPRNRYGLATGIASTGFSLAARANKTLRTGPTGIEHPPAWWRARGRRPARFLPASGSYSVPRVVAYAPEYSWFEATNRYRHWSSAGHHNRDSYRCEWL